MTNHAIYLLAISLYTACQAVVWVHYVVWVHCCMLTVHYLPGNAELLFMGMNRMGTEKQINQYIQCAIWLCKVCLFEIILSSVTFEMYTCLYYSIFIRCISFFDQLSWFFYLGISCLLDTNLFHIPVMLWFKMLVVRHKNNSRFAVIRGGHASLDHL